MFLSLNHSRHRNKSGISPSPSRYHRGLIPTENLRFDQFLEVVFNSPMKNDEIKEEIRDYVLVLETNYMDTISEIKQKMVNLSK